MLQQIALICFEFLGFASSSCYKWSAEHCSGERWPKRSTVLTDIYPKNAKQSIQAAGHNTFTTIQLWGWCEATSRAQVDSLRAENTLKHMKTPAVAYFSLLCKLNWHPFHPISWRENNLALFIPSDRDFSGKRYCIERFFTQMFIPFIREFPCTTIIRTMKLTWFGCIILYAKFIILDAQKSLFSCLNASNAVKSH